MYHCICWFVTLFVANLLCTFDAFDKNEYGPYELNWISLDGCQGPKRKDCADVVVTFSNITKAPIFHVNVTNQCSIQDVRVATYVSKKGTQKKMVGYNFNEPCQHFMFGPLLSSYFNVTKTCNVLKGYYIAEIDVTEKVKTFLGAQFFYGEYTCKTYITNKNKNFACIRASLGFVKIPEKH